MVYNHIGPEGSYLGEFGPHFTERHRTPWGAAVNYDDRGSDEVRAFVCNNVRMWIRDYHFEGLRLDPIHAIYDFGARHSLRVTKGAAESASKGRGYAAHVVAESDLNDVRVLFPPERGGQGLDDQWSDDFHRAVHVCLTGERQGYYVDYGQPGKLAKGLTDMFVLDGGYSRSRDRCHGSGTAGLPGDHFVVCIQNHDQVGNRAAGDRLSTLLSPPAQRLAASLLLLAPYLPLLFVGEEYGEPRPFQFFCSFSDPTLIENVRAGRRREFEAFHKEGVDVPDPRAESTVAASRLSWSWESDPHRSGLRRLYQDLLRARRSDFGDDLLKFIGEILLLQHRGDAENDFVARFQQATGLAMAKGAEDTAFYCYHRFVALNEVGGDPGRFGLPPEEFHAWCRDMQQHWPKTMLSTSTHDTKRSEDVRARRDRGCVGGARSIRPSSKPDVAPVAVSAPGGRIDQCHRSWPLISDLAEECGHLLLQEVLQLGLALPAGLLLQRVVTHRA